ncbi:MAG TPA: hypothetical protein VMU22_06380 [Rhizomicrobium sp.]|nr:hypothetical protein [Rhizomicrobium sp.]
MGFLRSIYMSNWTPWVLSWVLVVVLLCALTGRFSPSDELAYANASARLAAADRSQPLHMRLEAQFPGPLKDTTIERWRDPVDGSICYIYLPIAVAHGEGPNGLVQYGAANIGSISCFSARTLP